MNIDDLSNNELKLANSLSNAATETDKYIILLYKDFGYSLSKSQLAVVINKSTQTIDRRIKEGRDLPRYKKSGDGQKASFIFPILEVAKYLSNTIKVS